MQFFYDFILSTFFITLWLMMSMFTFGFNLLFSWLSVSVHRLDGEIGNKRLAILLGLNLGISLLWALLPPPIYLAYLYYLESRELKILYFK